MHKDWLVSQQQNGAHVDDYGVLDFGNRTAEIQAASSATILMDLSHLGVLRVAGEDAADFLQSQFSNDIRLVTAEQGQLSAYCTPKGRMLALMRILLIGDTYHLIVPREVLPALTRRLQMFVMRSRVTLEEAGDILVLGISGPQADALLQQQGLPSPETNYGSAMHDGVCVTRVSDAPVRFLLVGAEEKMALLWQGWAEAATTAGFSAWRWLDIQAGLPNVYSATQEAFVPQMTNLEILDGVNFKKGCYPGQEIVARMQYLGKLKQRMYRLHSDADIHAQSGDRLYAGSFGDNAAGTVVDAQPAPQGGVDLLAVTQIKSAEANDLHFEKIDGPILNIESLPYLLQ